MPGHKIKSTQFTNSFQPLVTFLNIWLGNLNRLVKEYFNNINGDSHNMLMSISVLFSLSSINFVAFKTHSVSWVYVAKTSDDIVKFTVMVLSINPNG